MDIQYLTHREIDKNKWDHRINQSTNGLIYAYSFYLDIMSAHWDALILGDYHLVMPLTWKSKFGIRYLYQPFLTAQLGIFGDDITTHHVKEFIHSIPSSFRLVEISLNASNLISGHEMGHRNNFILDLSPGYEKINSKYNTNSQRNIKKALQAGCSIERDFDVEIVIDLAINQMKSYKPESSDNVDRFRKVFTHLKNNNAAFTYGVKSAGGLLIATAVFFVMHKRAYYILVGNHPDSKATGASHLLIDGFIRDYAGRPMILDFEGSDISSLAFFYSGFGAVNEKYAFLRINRLPFYLRWMKK